MRAPVTRLAGSASKAPPRGRKDGIGAARADAPEGGGVGGGRGGGGADGHAEEAEGRHDDKPGVVDTGDRAGADGGRKERRNDEVEVIGGEADDARPHETADLAHGGIAPVSNGTPAHADETKR